MIKAAINGSLAFACLVGAYLSGLVAIGRISLHRASTALDIFTFVVLGQFLLNRSRKPKNPSQFLIEHQRAFKIGLYLVVASAFFGTFFVRIFLKADLNTAQINGWLGTAVLITLAVYYINQAIRPSRP